MQVDGQAIDGRAHGLDGGDPAPILGRAWAGPRGVALGACRGPGIEPLVRGQPGGVAAWAGGIRTHDGHRASSFHARVTMAVGPGWYRHGVSLRIQTDRWPLCSGDRSLGGPISARRSPLVSAGPADRGCRTIQLQSVVLWRPDRWSGSARADPPRPPSTAGPLVGKPARG